MALMFGHWDEDDVDFNGPMLGFASEARDAERGRMALAREIVDGTESWPRYADDGLERCVREVRARRGLD